MYRKYLINFLWFVAGLTVLLFATEISVYAAQSRVVMKDGRSLVGAIHPMKSVIELPLEKTREKAGVQSEKILLIDDELRRIYIPKNNVLDIVPDEISASLEVFNLPQRVNRNPREQVAMLGAFRQSTPFDDFGRRVIMVGGNPLIQGITAISPNFIRVEGINYFIDMRLSPYSIPRKKLSDLIKKQIDPKVLDERLRVYQFYVQAELYEQAAEELAEIINDFQTDEGNESRLKTGLHLIRQLAAQRLIDELELRRRCGQYKKVKSLLTSFESNGVSNEKIQVIRRMSAEHDETDRKRVRILELLAAEIETITDEKMKAEVAPIYREIERELNFNTIDRFAEFLLSQNDASLKDQARLAIGLSCWLGGNESADNRLEIALSMYKVRKLARRFFLEKIPDEREARWKEIEAEEAATPQRMAAIIRLMKPPVSSSRSSKSTPGYYELSVPSFNGQPITYYVQLPPEYDPNRKYPAIMTLHGERTTAPMQIDWWCGPWTARESNGNKVMERYGQATRNGYIVVAPVWSSGGVPWGYSAENHAAVLKVMRDALRRFSIDSDRFFLSGHSAGGNGAWDIGFAHPDLWAGVIPICGAAVRYCPPLKRNAQFLSVYAIGGELDGGSLNLSQEVLDWGMDMSRPYDFTFVQFKGRGNESFSDELIHLFEWMGIKERNFANKEERTLMSLRPWDNFFWSVELRAFPADTMTDPTFWTRGKLPVERPAKTEFFKIVGNSLKVKSTADQAVFCLTPDLLDFTQKAEVLFNSKKISPANGTLVPSSRIILEDVRSRMDRQHPFWVIINSDFPGKLNIIDN